MEKFKLDFNNYFNNILRDYLKYPETYVIDYYKDRFILKPSQLSDLLNIIKSNSDIKENLLKIITDFIRKLLPNVYDVSFNTDGTNLIIKFNTGDVSLLYEKFDPKGHLGIFANMASNLNLEDLDNFCRSNPKMVELCRDQQFWIQLLKEKFPRLIRETKDIYNWEQVYKILLDIKEKGKPRIKEIHGFDMDDEYRKKVNPYYQYYLKYPQGLLFLLKNKLISVKGALHLFLDKFIDDMKILEAVMNNELYLTEILGYLHSIIKSNDLELLKLLLSANNILIRNTDNIYYKFEGDMSKKYNIKHKFKDEAVKNIYNTILSEDKNFAHKEVTNNILNWIEPS